MHIKRLEIDNFKSFAGKTEIPFLTGFTAIAGINGSGKSNIIDSVLFALGLTSARALRSEKGVADLISTHNQRNEAYVKVVFDTDDETNSEISFARKVKKSSQGYTSTYYIDDKPQTHTQVISELEKYQITQNGNNIIMQGDVIGLVNCSSADRRVFIDEVAGTADFDRKIEMATKELNGVEERVQNSNLILTTIDERAEQLKEEREIALKYRELRENKEKLEGRISAVKYFDFKRILENVHQNILESQKLQKTKEKESKALESELENKRGEYEEICAKVKAQGEDKQLEVKRRLEEKKGEIQRKKDSIIHTEKIIFQNNKTIENAKNGIESFNTQKANCKNDITEKEEEKKELEE
ncbi:MAG: AAA family ATPase, partial [Candidatus Gastranaerophilales bacterium]|nr:AAA family ATPase [Candidatus Gastranaerophilales bacterium]